jgi:hypothetical protein
MLTKWTKKDQPLMHTVYARRVTAHHQMPVPVPARRPNMRNGVQSNSQEGISDNMAAVTYGVSRQGDMFRPSQALKHGSSATILQYVSYRDRNLKWHATLRIILGL